MEHDMVGSSLGQRCCIFKSLIEMRVKDFVDNQLIVTAYITVDCNVNIITHEIIHRVFEDDLITSVQIARLVLKVFETGPLVIYWSRDEDVGITKIAQQVKSEFVDVLKVVVVIDNAVVDVLSHLDSVSESFTGFDVLNFFNDDVRNYESGFSGSLGWWRIVDGENVLACQSTFAKIVSMLNFAFVPEASSHIFARKVSRFLDSLSNSDLLHKTRWTICICGTHTTGIVFSAISANRVEDFDLGLVTLLGCPDWCFYLKESILRPELVLLVDQLYRALFLKQECVHMLLVGRIDPIVITL